MSDDTAAEQPPDQPAGVAGVGATKGSGDPQLRRAGLAGLLVVVLVALVAMAGFALRGSSDDADQDAVDLQSVSTATIVFQPLDADDDADESDEDLIETEGPATSILVLPESTLPRDPNDSSSLEATDPEIPSTSVASNRPSVQVRPSRPSRPTTTTVPPPPPPPPLPPLPFSPFVGQVPTELCSIASLEGDLELRFDADPRCAGPWAVVDLTSVRDVSCPPEMLDAEQVCHAVQIMRWTTTGWQNRGVRDARCYDSVIQSGVSRPRNAEMFGNNESCMVRISYRDEPASGDLRQGDRGLRVAELQIRLREAGVLTDGVDGRYGRNTRAAVFDLQYLLDLEPTGVANEALFLALALPLR
jgi:hypothetical protein